MYEATMKDKQLGEEPGLDGGSEVGAERGYS